MASFVQHESCPRCGSRDNLGRYSDGSGWCFGCHLFIPVRNSGAIHDVHTQSEHSEHDFLRLPPDACKDFPEQVVSWLRKYDISVEEALKWGWLYSPWYNQLIFPFYGTHRYSGTEGEPGDTDLLLYQARNFDQGRASKRKYYNQGSPADVLPIFTVGGNQFSSLEKHQRRLVVVEDCVSAAKIARQSDAMPLLGSYLPARKITALKRLYDGLVVWLDADKYKEACNISDLCKWIGMSTKVIFTELDPKEYSDEEIKHLTNI